MTVGRIFNGPRVVLSEGEARAVLRVADTVDDVEQFEHLVRELIRAQLAEIDRKRAGRIHG